MLLCPVKETEACSEPAWEHTEQLYLLEVLVDEVTLEPTENYTLEDPIMELVGKVCFLDLPEMEVQPNELGASRRKTPGEDRPQIPGLPEHWDVCLACDLPDYQLFPQYEVSIDVVHPESGKSYLVTLLVPKIAIEAGEGLRYIFTALERKVDPELMPDIKKQIKEELEKEKDRKDLEKPIVFASGKSCLFQMTPYELIKSLERYPFYVLLYRQGLVDGVPIRHLLGRVRLMLREPFEKAVTAAEGAASLPVSAHIECSCDMDDLFCERTGSMGLFVRLSCFGRSVSRPPPIEEAPPAEQVEQDCGRRRPFRAMMAEEDDLLKGWCRGWQASEDRVPITWRRADEVQPRGFKPSRAELAGALRAMPPPPPSKQPPPDPWLGLTGLERCRPGVSPPCYRRPGDPPIPPCKQLAEAQLQREDLTKAVQTEPVPTVNRLPQASPYMVNNPCPF